MIRIHYRINGHDVLHVEELSEGQTLEGILQARRPIPRNLEYQIIREDKEPERPEKQDESLSVDEGTPA